MKKHLFAGVFFVMNALLATTALSQVVNDADGNFDSTSYVETDSTTNTTSNVTSTNTNNNTNTNTTTVDSTSTSTNTNNNNNTSTSTSTVNQTINQTTTSTIDQTIDQTINQTTNSTINSTSNNTNTNTNTNNSTINSTATNNNNNNSNVTQEITSPPPSAIAPTIQSGGNDTCTVTYSAAVQTQILGASGGGHVRDLNCERLKNAKTLYNMGMKVAAVSLMCQDESVFRAMEMAGTPCPFDGSIGVEAQAKWDENPDMAPVDKNEVIGNDQIKSGILGGLAVLLLMGL